MVYGAIVLEPHTGIAGSLMVQCSILHLLVGIVTAMFENIYCFCYLETTAAFLLFPSCGKSFTVIHNLHWHWTDWIFASQPREDCRGHPVCAPDGAAGGVLAHLCSSERL